MEDPTGASVLPFPVHRRSTIDETLNGFPGRAGGEAMPGSRTMRRVTVLYTDIRGWKDVAERTGQPIGLRVVEVVPDAPAARGGIRQGDIILTAAGQRIPGAQALQRLMLADAIGSAVPITVVRNGALVDVIVTPVELMGDRPRR